MRDRADRKKHPLKNILGTALVGVAGVTAFNSLKGKEVLSDVLPKAGKLFNSLADDFAKMSRKDYTYDNLSNIYERRISNLDSTLNELKNELPKLQRINTSGENAMAAIVKYNEIKANPDNLLRKLFTDDYRDEISSFMKEKYGNRDTAFQRQIEDITKRAIEKKDLIVATHNDQMIMNDEVINRLIDTDNLGSSGNAFFNDLISFTERESVEGAYSAYKEKHKIDGSDSYDIIDNVLNEFSKNNFESNFGTGSDEPGFINSIINADYRPATIGDYLLQKDKFEDQIITIGDKQIALKDMVEEFSENHGDISNIILDRKNISINADDDIVNMSEVNSYANNFKRKLAGTIPGKILKVSDGLNNDVGSFNVLRKGTSSLLLKDIDGSDKTLNNPYMQILNKYYKVNKDNSISEIPEFGDDIKTLLSYHGSTPRMLSSMFGLNKEVEALNSVNKWLDIGTVPSTGFFDKNSESSGVLGNLSRKITGKRQINIVDELFKGIPGDEDALEYRKNLKALNSIYSTITEAPSKRVIGSLMDSVRSDKSKRILEIIMQDNEEDIINDLSSMKKEFINNDLKSLIGIKTSNRSRADRILSIKSDKINGNKNVLRYSDMIRRESVKEALQVEAKIYGTRASNANKIMTAIERTGLKRKEVDNLKNLSHWAMLQEKGMLYGSNKNEKILDAIIESNLEVANILMSTRDDNYGIKDTTFITEMQKGVKNIGENFSELATTTRGGVKKPINKLQEVSHGEIIAMRKSYSLLDFSLDTIGDLNDKEKIKANAKKFGMQFVAGRDTPEYVTSSTMIPYFFADRLVQPFKNVKLPFSNDNTKNVLQYSSNIMTKRIAPLALGVTALSYLNFESKNLTGTSITGAVTQGLGNVDLGLRKVADATGIGFMLDAERKLNPLTRYWLGDDYQDSTERKDYYENGYDAVRKGRWWAFGSASELRGGKITYFQPNFIKRANSDWKDEGLYGGANEKWKHSWIPTPRHPLAPIRKALDPYWLEKKHKDDRPYMQTAPLFSQGTPWGAILNPTIGEVIKPIKNMHKNETRRGLVDPRTLISERNSRIKEKARDKTRSNLVKISMDGINNVAYTPQALADPSKAVIGMNIKNGRIGGLSYNGLGYAESVQPINDYDITQNENENEETPHGFDGNVQHDISTRGDAEKKGIASIVNRFETTNIGAAISNETSKLFTNSYGYNAISSINNQTKKTAYAKSGTEIEKTNLADLPANVAAKNITNKQDEADLLNTSSRYDFVSDLLFSGKQLGGIYGFLAGSAQNSKRKVRRESAGNMNSFTRSFWDMNIGGLGGGAMEIARRFFPHQDHDWTNVNPIRNKMPDWMPSRFLVGDPYTKVQKGEMRLPGKGYESINKLRSDMYGEYGALDRMKILADIAPWSDEYKIWRDVSQKTIIGKRDRKEIEDIKKRVEKQSSNHDFYEYRFLKNKTTIDKATVASVEGQQIKTTEGKTFKLAGVSLTNKDGLSNFIGEGSSIRVEYLKKDKEKDVINSAVYLNGDNLNKNLIRSGQAEEKIDDTSMSAKAVTGHMSQLYGASMELLTHAPIPFVHNKLMRIDTPIDSFKNERVYGTPYSTWDHPIKGFLMPAIQKAWAGGPTRQGVALGGWALAETMWKNPEKFKKGIDFLGGEISETGVNKLASVTMNILNPGAFVGSMVGALPTGAFGGDGLKGLLSLDVFGAGVKSDFGRNSARIGATVGIVGYGLSRSTNPLKSTAIFGAAGISLANQLKKEGFGGKEGAIAGATFGLALSAIRNPRLDTERMLGVYVPKDTKKRRDIDEYYDRLDYIKYQGLYNKSSRKARLFEGANIKNLLRGYEYRKDENQKKINKATKRIKRINDSNLNNDRKTTLLNSLKQDQYALSYADQTIGVGKYSKAAIAYKQAADSTIYGLKKGATAQQVLRAIPKADKDFFMKFIKEDDSKERKKILKYVSPYQRRALQIAWGFDDVDDPKSNNEYFRNHNMPGVFWAGWKPQVNLDNVKIKTIENEGMLLSDFGIYESQANDPAAQNAPMIGNFDKSNSGALGIKSRLLSALNGSGLIGTKVAISPTASNGIQVISNIENSAKITEYNIREKIGKVIGTRTFY